MITIKQANSNAVTGPEATNIRDAWYIPGGCEQNIEH